MHLASPSGSVAVTGDGGRPHYPLMLPPEPLPAADAIITESTYGDRTHPEIDVTDLLVAGLGEHRLDLDACRALWSGVEVHRSVRESSS